MNNNAYHIISFYTDADPSKSTYYKDNYLRLKQEIDNIGIPYSIDELPSKKDYMENCLRKPKYILEKIKQLNTPVLWMDIDCYINDYPHDFIDTNYDICVSIREKRSNEIIPESCFVYFNNTQESINFINDWSHAAENAIRDLDHLILIDLYNYYKKYKKIKIKEYDWWYASPKKLKAVKIIMGNSISPDKRQTEMSIRKQGRI
jgi:hypothetical protein